MKMWEFTVEEINMIAIYIAESRSKTIFRLHDAYPLMDEDMLEIATSSARKLSIMTDAEFELANFLPAK